MSYRYHYCYRYRFLGWLRSLPGNYHKKTRSGLRASMEIAESALTPQAAMRRRTTMKPSANRPNTTA